jgi:hypothetical protein
VIFAIPTVALLLVWLCFFSDPDDSGLVGTSRESFMLDDRFVIVNNGYSFGSVTYVVVRNWPASSFTE